MTKWMRVAQTAVKYVEALETDGACAVSDALIELKREVAGAKRPHPNDLKRVRAQLPALAIESKAVTGYGERWKVGVGRSMSFCVDPSDELPWDRLRLNNLEQQVAKALGEQYPDLWFSASLDASRVISVHMWIVRDYQWPDGRIERMDGAGVGESLSLLDPDLHAKLARLQVEAKTAR